MSTKICLGPNCGRTLAKGTRGEFCRSCYTNRDLIQSNISLNLNPTFDPNGNTGDLKVSDLIAIIRQEVAVIVDDINGRLVEFETRCSKIEDQQKENQEKTKKAVKDVETLKLVIIEQQKFLEILRKKATSSNIVISGIPNDPWTLNNEVQLQDDNTKLEEIFRHIDCVDKLLAEHEITPFKSQEGKKTHMIKVKFTKPEIIKDIFEKAKILKTFELGKIYINSDEPYHTRRENNRLRKKKAELIVKHPGDDIKISKGKLYHKETIVDSFNLSNQLF